MYQLLTDLIRFPSISSSSNVEVSRFLITSLKQLGFEIEELPYVDAAGVAKLSVVAKRDGSTPDAAGGLAYFGHTDVVPANTWTGPGGAFEPLLENQKLYGRGSCDMKGSIAAMLEACNQVKRHRLPIWIVLTGDEETGMWGAMQVAEKSQQYRSLVAADAAGIIGEPTNGKVIHGHKGIAVWTARAEGRVGHSSTREGESATLKLVPFLAAVQSLASELEADSLWHDDRYDPASPTLNMTIQDDAPALNVTAGEAVAKILVRNSPDLDLGSIDDRLRRAADATGVELSPLCERAAIYRDRESSYVAAVDSLVGDGSPTTVPYGTDGSCFGDVNRLVVFGPGSIQQAHTTDEFIALAAYDRGVDNFRTLIERFANDSP